MDEQGPDLRRNAAVPTQKAFSTAPRVLAMPRSAPLIAHLQGQGQESAQDSRVPEKEVRLHEDRSGNPFKMARSGYGGTGSGVSQGVIAGAEFTRGPLQPTWAAELADRRRAQLKSAGRS
ncbi:unnamed protein product [Symbiodinium pilosum]|uniref:Uncharacterized protein n=1 Tax=Symbiodinium pilosum TaxID=2952 RepID=A0A812LFB2_SYMPI|nr:unnamed protein product [Symbiodinium pilosum]